ncbi:MAG: hemolysin family protein [Gemmatimonadetes bacterium]|nr:hemolysin family protein [Gemmatimonadota bacterium]
MTWLLAAVGLLLTAFGATAGAALVSVSRVELTQMVSLRLRGRRGPLSPMGRIDELLTAASATTSLGVVLLGVAVPAAVSGPALRPLALVIVVLAIPAVVFGGYFFPRWLTEPRALRLTKWVAPVLEVWAAPLWWVLPAHKPSRLDDLRSLWREGAAVGVTEDEHLLQVESVINFAGRPVQQVMTPRTEVVAVSEDADLADIRIVFAESGYSRLPVYRGTLDEIIGMVYAFDLLKLSPGDTLPVRTVAATPASRNCGDLLLDMRRERRHLAVVLDEFGGTLGIATLEDLLEELVGEIFDEHDHAVAEGPDLGPGIFETDGTTDPAVIGERFGVTLPDTGATTISGLLTDLAGRIPYRGERLLVSGLEFDVVEASPTRLQRLLIRPGPVSSVPLTRRTS